MECCSHNTLEVAILSNASFSQGSANRVWKSLHGNLKFLGIGGSYGINCATETLDLAEPPSTFPSKSHPQQLVVETTFVDDADLAALSSAFPGARFVDLCRDSIDSLEDALYTSGVNGTMRSALSTCHDSRNRTPLHIACHTGDVRRASWLLRHMRARYDLKDNKGATPLHR